jgi:hypothetical protein
MSRIIFIIEGELFLNFSVDAIPAYF